MKYLKGDVFQPEIQGKASSVQRWRPGRAIPTPAVIKIQFFKSVLSKSSQNVSPKARFV